MTHKTACGGLFYIAVVTGTVALLVAPSVGAAEERSIIGGSVRFQVLEPGLIRMEYSPAAKFIDDASVAVINRDDWRVPQYNHSEKDGWIIVSTEKMTVRYRKDSGPFGADNLAITWIDKSGSRSWKPGDKDDKNLGGVPGTMDNRSTFVVTDPGPLTRNGYYLLDDSHTALFDKATDWVKPRPVKDGQDWYFLVYGNDYASGLASLAKLAGPIPMLPRYVFGAWIGSRRLRGRSMEDDRRTVPRRGIADGYDRARFLLDAESDLGRLRLGLRTNARSQGVLPMDEEPQRESDAERALLGDQSRERFEFRGDSQGHGIAGKHGMDESPD